MLLLPISDDNPTRRPPVVTRTLLGISVALWLFGVATGLQRGIFYTLGLVPADFHFLNLFTSQFIHSGIFHLAGNMLFFWIFADNVEDRLGRPWFLFMYLTSGAVGALAHCVFVPGEHAQLPLGGASGAISGVMGAYLVFYPRQPIRIFYLIFIFPGVFHARALWVVGLYGLQQVLAILLTGGTGGGVAYWAHLGGFAAGLAFACFDRLRGGLPHDVSGNPAEIPWALHLPTDVPVERPGGGWAVLRADDALADESGSAGVVARVTGEARRGITRRLRRTRGVVAHGLTLDRARALREALRAGGGPPVLLVDEARVPALPPPAAARTGACGPQGILFEMEGGGQWAIPWNRVIAVFAARVGKPGASERITGGASVEATRIDVLTSDPLGRVRLDQDAWTGGTAMASPGMAAFCAGILRYRGPTPVNSGVSVAAARGHWGFLHFPTEPDYEDYAWWLFQLILARRGALPVGGWEA